MKPDGQEQSVCDICGRPPLWGRALFRLSTARGSAWHCERCAVRHPRLVRQSVKTALVVGTLLALINHGSVYWTGPVTFTLAAKTVLTYCVPFAVAMWGALMANRGYPTKDFFLMSPSLLDNPEVDSCEATAGLQDPAEDQ